jgi:Arc/MetJ-type ribon-helix-helix transcriptional regulator
MSGKQPISVTLTPENITWLKSRAQAERFRSMSELLDRLIEEARNRGSAHALCVAGTIDIHSMDPDLDSADEAVRRLFQLEDKPAKKKNPRGSAS